MVHHGVVRSARELQLIEGDQQQRLQVAVGDRLVGKRGQYAPQQPKVAEYAEANIL
jgi:hypothetical protein